MVDQHDRSDIRSFFKASSSSPKRPSQGSPRSARGAPKSPRIQPPSGAEKDQATPSRSRSNLVDIASSDEAKSKEYDSTPEPTATDAPLVDDQQRSSFGSLSNISQTTSSQRIIRNGEVVVTNSDEESASDDEPADLALILGLANTKQSKLPIVESQSPSRTQPSPAKGFRQSTGLKRHFKVDTSFKSRRLMDDLVTRSTKEREAVERVEKALQSINESDLRIQKLQDQITSANGSGDIDPSTVASMMGGDADEEGIGRLIQAVRRTDALQSKALWSFWDQTPDVLVPKQPPSSIRNLFGKSSHIEAALLGGYISELASSGHLAADHDNLEWTLSVALNSPRDDLYTAYCDILAHAGSEEWLGVDWIWRMFALIGASGDALNQDTPVLPRICVEDRSTEGSRNWPRVIRILKIVRRCAGRLPAQTRRDAIIFICRLALDVEVNAHHLARIQLCHTFDTLLNAVPLETFSEEVLYFRKELPRQIPDAQLQIRLLRCLVGSSSRAFYLRRMLACEFFFTHVQGTQRMHEDENHLANVSYNLEQRSEFSIRPDTDFTLLTAMIDILDVYLDDGRFGCSLANEQSIKEFNRSVDRLADHIKSMATSIRDSGANHLARTEAKESLDALHARLLFAVRTAPRPKKSIFGADVDVGSMGKQSFLTQYLKVKDDKTMQETDDK